MSKLPPPLPPPVVKGSEESALDASRVCPKCGGETRIASNHLGVRAHCGKCKNSWAVSGPRDAAIPQIPERGLSKRTLVEPDWDRAFERN